MVCSLFNNLIDVLSGSSYLEMLKEVVEEYLDNLSLTKYCKIYFQQDGVPAHTTRTVREWLTVKFDQRWIGRTGPIDWPPGPQI